MVQKSDSKPRGRPKAYDPDQALSQAMGTFWDAGFAATSLDDLSVATGMNRPSLYGAFGDKRALYLKTLNHYREFGRTALGAALSHDEPIADALRRVYQRALSIYLSGEEGARGCYLIGTAATESVGDPEVRAALADGLHELDDGFEARLKVAQKRGELRQDIDAKNLARLASAFLHTLSLRARAGESRKQLEGTVEAAVGLICGEGKS